MNGTLIGKTQGVQEDVLPVGERLNYRVQELIGYVVLVHLLCAKEFLVAFDQEARDLF